MPIVVDPGFAWPPEVDPVVSPDGRITAIIDPAHAGVLLRADFDDSKPSVPGKPEVLHRRNLARNPSFSYMDRMFDSGQITGIAGADVSVSRDWSSRGQTALKIGVASATANYTLATVTREELGERQSDAGKTFTVAADIHLDAKQTGALWNNARQINITTFGANGSLNAHFVDSVSAPNEPGTTRLKVTFTLPADCRGWAIRLTNGSTTQPVWWDCLSIEEGTTSGAYFDGDSSPASGRKLRWTGQPQRSSSEEFTPEVPAIPAQEATTAKVRFERQDGSLVRSGSPAWAPGGYAHAYDHEATLGGGTLWRAVPIRFDGTEGEPSEYVGAVIPGLSDGWAWLKPVTDPDKAMLLKVEPPDLSYDGRVDTTSIAGAPRPAATWDILEGFTTQLRSLVREKDVEEQLMALLDEGPVLAQFPACAGLPDFYFIRGKLDLEHVHWDGWPWRRYQWDAIQIDRPDTTDSPLRIPGLSYDTVARDWTTYDQLAATVESYNKLLEP